ncbi:LOW QUALITY PROTEIN: hypothetical protein CFOL_v3_13350 [Cephalotus follicularis]|uniref:Uncharacterized protein n=1 Tax=Cephalotus follicularis TaxID=3775 RepID=A0A1Q3BPP0_CEPFO|nr:LOW QUALITY PROTEIN: hypothetical protein CFOL_v3_13350 [Cephalotus follicularis]
MANPPRSSKRVHAIQRALDGSAFEKCDCCGDLVVIALTDMHDCGTGKDAKRFKGIFGNPNVNKCFCDQPRSAFKFFMESFKETYKTRTVIDIDEKGFETWKNKSKEVMLIVESNRFYSNIFTMLICKNPTYLLHSFVLNYLGKAVVHY